MKLGCRAKSTQRNAKLAKSAKIRKRVFSERKVLEDDISNEVIGAAIEVHRILGPGLLESIYESSLCHELKLRGLNFKTQIFVPIKYKGESTRDPLLLDILVDNKVIIEVKATEKDHPSHKAQLLTYLKMTGIKLGLVINFGHSFLKDGIHRVVNQL